MYTNWWSFYMKAMSHTVNVENVHAPFIFAFFVLKLFAAKICTCKYIVHTSPQSIKLWITKQRQICLKLVNRKHLHPQNLLLLQYHIRGNQINGLVRECLLRWVRWPCTVWSNRVARDLFLYICKRRTGNGIQI